MPSDRDLAQQWLAEVLICDENPMIKTNLPNGACDCDECRMRVAAAILDTPGVEVREEWAVRLVRSTDGKTENRSMPRGDALDFIADYHRVGEHATAHGRAWLWEPSLAHRSVITTPWTPADPAQRSGVAAQEEP